MSNIDIKYKEPQEWIVRFSTKYVGTHEKTPY